VKSRLIAVSVGIAVGLVLIGVLHVLAQPGSGGEAPGMMAGWPPAPTAVVVAGEGGVYVACDGTLTAFEAGTLKPVGTAAYWERPETAQ